MENPIKKITPEIDYRIENWPAWLQKIFWADVVLGLAPRFLLSLATLQPDKFFKERTYLSDPYDTISRIFELKGRPGSTKQ